jgi:hypothetical protein
MKEKEKEILLGQLQKTPIVQLACEKTGVSRSTYYRWREADQEFAKDADEALHQGNLLMNDFAESTLLSAIRDGNIMAAMQWLRHHHPLYANKIELSGKLTYSDEELTPEQTEIVKQALRLASFGNKTNEP